MNGPLRTVFSCLVVTSIIGTSAQGPEQVDLTITARDGNTGELSGTSSLFDDLTDVRHLRAMTHFGDSSNGIPDMYLNYMDTEPLRQFFEGVVSPSVKVSAGERFENAIRLVTWENMSVVAILWFSVIGVLVSFGLVLQFTLLGIKMCSQKCSKKSALPLVSRTVPSTTPAATKKA
ncbi:putative transmembrane protein [Toxoplasma gondii FOU]|uniref:Putative transmembrane protein n=1 Tax=Toxoplasma gondii FOU TaxID=943167 RepID=A0A086LA18_TOXGO|nr:putative transmembrane protein [Toxoplasma gondii FOU]